MKGGHILHRDVECSCRHQCLTSGWIHGSSDKYNNAYGGTSFGRADRAIGTPSTRPCRLWFGRCQASPFVLEDGLAVWGTLVHLGSDIERTGGLLSFLFDEIYEASFFQDISPECSTRTIQRTTHRKRPPAQSIRCLTWVRRPGRNNRDLLPDARFANAQTRSEPFLVAILRAILSHPQDGRGNMVRWTGKCCAGPRTERCNVDKDQLVKPCQAFPVEMWFARLYAAH